MESSARGWWPVGPSIAVFLVLIGLPIVGTYFLVEQFGNRAFLAVLIMSFVTATVMTVLEFWLGREMRGRVINHADVASAFFGFIVTGTIGNGIVIVLLAPLSDSVSAALHTDFWPSSWPLIVQVIVGLIVADLVMYPIHRYMHKHDGLWRVHVVHHSVSELRPMRNFLQHPFEVLLLGVVPAIPLVVLGAPAMVAVLVGAVRIAVGIVDHSSIPMRTGWLDYVIHTPNDHWWHHNLEDRGGANFTTVVIELDIIFRTFKKPPAIDPVPVDIGIREPTIDGNRYMKQLAVPFHWKAVKESGHA